MALLGAEPPDDGAADDAVDAVVEVEVVLDFRVLDVVVTAALAELVIGLAALLFCLALQPRFLERNSSF